MHYVNIIVAKGHGQKRKINMKIVTFGKEIQNNKRTRYALIIMKLDRKTRESLDNTITFVYSNNLKELVKTETHLHEVAIDKPHYMDTKIFDYQEMRYC